MNVGLVGPCDVSVTGNLGWHMITAGIRWLVRQAVPEVGFTPVNMFQFDDSWAAAEACCDVVIICGNPRFTLSEGDAFWEHDMWHRLHALHLQGVRIIDGWAGSAFPYAIPPRPVEEMVTALTYAPRRRDYLNIAAQFHGRITRDATAQGIYERAGLSSVLLPCSSWWAQAEYGIARSEAPATHNLVIVHRTHDDAELIPTIRAMTRHSLNGLPFRMIATTWQDHVQAVGAFPAVELVADAASLLRVCAAAGQVLSFRLHAAIPAASMGCAVCAVNIDSRTDACAPFGLPVVGFTELEAATYGVATPPDTASVVQALREMLL